MSDAPPQAKRIRKPFDPLTMGFGRHKYEHIDPKTLDMDKLTEPPNGIRTRDFSVAFNKKHPQTDMTIDLMSRTGCVFETTAPGYEGRWVVTGMPTLRSAVMYVVAAKADHYDAEAGVVTDRAQPSVEISSVDLGTVPDRFSNLYKADVVTKHVSGGTANRETRERLTKTP